MLIFINKEKWSKDWADFKLTLQRIGRLGFVLLFSAWLLLWIIVLTLAGLNILETYINNMYQVIEKLLEISIIYAFCVFIYYVIKLKPIKIFKGILKFIKEG